MKRQYKYNTFVNDESIFTFIFTLKVLLFIDMCACLCVCACGDPFFLVLNSQLLVRRKGCAREG